jgi:hypothetical protein
MHKKKLNPNTKKKKKTSPFPAMRRPQLQYHKFLNSSKEALTWTDLALKVDFLFFYAFTSY